MTPKLLTENGLKIGYNYEKVFILNGEKEMTAWLSSGLDIFNSSLYNKTGIA